MLWIYQRTLYGAVLLSSDSTFIYIMAKDHSQAYVTHSGAAPREFNTSYICQILTIVLDYE